MTRLHALLAVFPIFAIASVSAQTVTTPTRNSPATQESFVPSPGSLLLSAGPAIVSDSIDVPFVKTGSTKMGYGGYIALDYFVTKALSLRSELTVTTISEGTNIVATVSRRGTLLSVALNIPGRTVFFLDVGAKFYPLQLTEYANFRLQPFVKVAGGGMFFIPSTSADESPSIDPCPFIRAGGGADFAFNARWSATAEADYYTSLSDATLHADGLLLSARDYGVLATVGIRYRFW